METKTHSPADVKVEKSLAEIAYDADGPHSGFESPLSTGCVRERYARIASAVEAAVKARQKPAYFVTAETPPTEADGDKQGQVLAFRNDIGRWTTQLWETVVRYPDCYSIWQPLPSVPVSPDDAAKNAAVSRFIRDMNGCCSHAIREAFEKGWDIANAHRGGAKSGRE